MSLKFKNIIKFICIIIYLSSSKLLIAGEWTIFEGFESNSFDGVPDSLVWTQGGDADWVIDSDASEGSYSAKSGLITHNQTSTISTTAEIPYLPGKISFSFKTSTEPNYDKLKFYVDGVEREQWDGINSWTNVEFVLNPSPNTYTFTWEYYKDGSVDTNDDAVWIDDIRIIGHEIVVNAGAPIDTVFIHDGVLGGNVQLDGSGTYPDENADLSVPGLVAWFENQMNWYLSDNLDSVIATGVRPIVNLDCIMSEDDNLCIGNHTIVLKIEFSGFSESSEVSVTTTEPNQAPILEVSSSVDTLTIANNNGIPGNSTSVNLMSQFFDQIEFYDPDVLADGTQDNLSLSWQDANGNSISPIQSVSDGDYTFKLNVTDPYGSFVSSSFNLSMIEENDEPSVLISVINETDIGLDQNFIENQNINLYGFIDDSNNDINGSTSTSDDDIDLLWECTHDGNPLVINNENALNTFIESTNLPDVTSNSDIEILVCSLQATDPFQELNNTTSISEFLNITLYNDNQPPEINVDESLEVIAGSRPNIIEEESLEILITDLISSSFITIIDNDGDNINNFVLEIDSGENYILNNNIIIPDSQYFGEIRVPIRISDEFFFLGELYNNLSETAYLIIDVIGVNDAPVLESPYSNDLATPEGQSLVINNITVYDQDFDIIENNFNLKFEINVTHGMVSLGSTSELLFDDNCNCDGIDDSFISFLASPSKFNNAMSNITFYPEENYYSNPNPNAEISINVNDLGNVGIADDGTSEIELSDTYLLSINIQGINDPPIFSTPTLITVNEDSEILINDFSVSDVDIADYPLELDLAVTNGLINISDTLDIDFDYGGYGENEQVSFSGTITAVNNLLNSIIFSPNEHFNGTVQLEAFVDDLGADGTGGSLTDNQYLTIDVIPVNDSPEAIDDSYTITEEQELTGNVLDNDLDLDETNGSSPDSHFSLTVNTIPIQNVEYGSLSLLSDGSFTYQPFSYFNGQDTFLYELVDGEGATDQSTVTISILAVNNQPEITLPSNRITYEDTELEITGISISDQDIADGNMEVELSVDSGFITLGSLSGLTFSSPADADGVDDQSLIFLGTLTDISNALNPIIFTPQEDFNGDVQLYIKVNDLGGTGSGGPLQDDNFLFITVNAVNDTPSAVNDIGSVDEDTILIGNVLDNDFDLDSTNGSSPDSHYSLSIDINPITNVQNGVLLLTNDGNYTYTPYSNYNGVDSFVYTLFDGAGGESQGMVDITINGVNDPPILNVPNNKSTNEDTQITINGFSVEDIDIDVNDMRMDIYVENSLISLSSTNGLVFINGNSETGSGSQLTFTGNKTNIVEAVNDMIFTPDENYNGEVIVDITISDLGGSGSGNAESDSESFVVTVESVNDPPVISFTELTNYNEDIEFSIYGVSISDIDAIESSNEVQVTLSVQNGQLSLVSDSYSSFNFLEGSGILDSEMTFVGSISDINIALNGFSFLGNENYNGEDFISLEVSDLGNSGAGDILIDQVIIPFTLEPINDPPVNQTPVGVDSPPTLNIDGVIITASPGIWNDKIDTDISTTSENITFDFQWQRNSINCSDGFYYGECNDEGNFLDGESCGNGGVCLLLEQNWFDIVDENSETYEIVSLDAQKYLRVEVTATDDGVGTPSEQSTISNSDYYYVNNSTPIAQQIEYSDVLEDNVYIVDAPGLLVNDLDPDNDVSELPSYFGLSAFVVNQPTNGEVVLNSNGSFTYTPDENFNGNDSFEYRVYDGALYSDENALVNISVASVNDVPQYSSGGNVETSENLGLIELFGWATDISDGDPEIAQTLEFSLIALNPDIFEIQPSVDPISGALSFSIFDNLNGSSDVVISLKDDGGVLNEGVDETEPSQFTINVIPINDSPSFTVGDTINVLEDSGLYSQSSWATDINDGDSELVQELSFSVISNDNALLFSEAPSVDANGNITFTVNEDQSGLANIILTLVDNGSGISPNSNTSEEKQFVINVIPVNDIPEWSVGERIEILEDSGPQNIINYITNIDDGDPEIAQILTFNRIDVTNSSLFAMEPEIDANGTLTFTINEDLNGTSLVYFTLSDDGGTDNGGINQTSQQFFEIQVIAVNDPPIFEINDLGELAEDDFEVAQIIVTPNLPPNDEGSQSVQYSLSTFEAINENGMIFANLSIENLTGNVTINPVEHGNGETQITITANDGSGSENGGSENYEQTFTYRVNDINDAPVNVDLPIISGNPFVDSLLVASEGIWTDSLDTDFSGDSEITYEFRWERADNNTEPLINLQYIGNAVFNEYEITQSDFHKFLRVKVIATDNGPGSIPLDSFIYSDFIEVLNTPPVAVDDSYTVDEDSQIELDFESGLLLGWNQGDECVRFDDTYVTDCDRDGDALTVSLASGVSFGELTLNQDGSFIYLPDSNVNEVNMNISDNVLIDQFTYTVSDGESSSVPARVSIIVNPVNDAPVFELIWSDENESFEDGIINLYEDFGTQFVSIFPGLIPVDEMGQTVEYVISPSNINSADVSIISSNSEVVIEIVSKLDLYETIEFTVSAIDDGGVDNNGEDQFSQTFVLDIISVNDQPSFLKGNNQNVLEDSGPIIISSWASEISKGPSNESNQELEFIVTTSNDDFFKNSIIPAINPFNGDLFFEIADDLNGEVEVSLILKDNGGTEFEGSESNSFLAIDESDIQVFNISVEAVNDPPTFVIGSESDLIINEDDGSKTVSNWITNIKPGPEDESNQVLTFAISASKVDSTIFSQFPRFIFNGDSSASSIEYSLNPNFNGKPRFTVNLSDDGGKDNEGNDISENKYFDIWIHQINDSPNSFNVYPRIYEYNSQFTENFVNTYNVNLNENPYPDFYIDTESNGEIEELYFRLPYKVWLDSDNQIPSLLKFSWEKSSDIDTNIDLNLDSLYSLYYRLEVISSINSKKYILADRINNATFSNQDSISIEIDMTLAFPFYSNTFNPDSMYSSEYLDTTGVDEYTWRVVAQNYSNDYLGNDPSVNHISTQSIKIDLEVPEAEMIFSQSELFSEYYDLYFLTNEQTLDSLAEVRKYDESGLQLFSGYPSKFGDSLYHISSTFINTGIFNFNFQARDERLNLGRSLDTVTYDIIIPELSRQISSHDRIVDIYFTENSVETPTPILITSSGIYRALYKNNVDFLTLKYSIHANTMYLNEPVLLSFKLPDDYDDELFFKYKIARIVDNEIFELETIIDSDYAKSSVFDAGSYALIFNHDEVMPIPEHFKLNEIYPNPFNPMTTIKYEIPIDDKVVINIFDIRGKHINKIVDSYHSPGYYSAAWVGDDFSGKQVSSGIYFISIKFSNQTINSKVTFIK